MDNWKYDEEETKEEKGQLKIRTWSDKYEDVEPVSGVGLFGLYLFFHFNFFPLSFVLLKAFLVGGSVSFAWTFATIILFVLVYAGAMLILPIYILHRKDLSIRHKNRIRLFIGNSIVLLIWTCVFILTPIFIDRQININEAQRAFIVFIVLYAFDIISQIFLLRRKECDKHNIRIYDIISFALSIIVMCGYGASVCPIIFNKNIERIIFDISLLVFVIGVSIVNFIIYKKKKNKVEEDYKYQNFEHDQVHRLLAIFCFEGLLCAL